MRIIRTIVIALATIVATACAPAPAQAAAPSIGIDWPKTTAPSKRVIEVVDKIKPTTWKVGTAVSWLDRYTASDMRVVARCSGKAYRCITIRQGKVKGSPVGWSSGSTVTIDTGKAASGKYRPWYRIESRRTWLLIHELGHQHGLKHGTGRHVMNPAVNRYKLVLTSGQKTALRSR